VDPLRYLALPRVHCGPALPVNVHALEVRLKGGSDLEIPQSKTNSVSDADAGMPTGEEGEGQSAWDRYSHYEETEAPSYELVRNLTFKLPERSRRLGPLQMSWGLADPTIGDDDEWRNQIRASISGEPIAPSDDFSTIPSSGSSRGSTGNNDDTLRDVPDKQDGAERMPAPDRIFQSFIDGAGFWNAPRGRAGGRGNAVHHIGRQVMIKIMRIIVFSRQRYNALNESLQGLQGERAWRHRHLDRRKGRRTRAHEGTRERKENPTKSAARKAD
jgi:hypothetical protein